MALGARESAAVWLVLRAAIVTIEAGITVGLPRIRALGRLVESQLFGARSRYTMPSCRARRAACVRSRTSSLVRMFVT
jgi:hypothetical protein